MLLTIDIGNTNLTLGLYEGEQLGAHWRLATDQARMPDEYGLQFLGLLEHAGCRQDCLTGIVLASVVPNLTGRVIQACREYLDQEPLVVDTGVKTGLRIHYEDPKAVGADRVADAVAVLKLYGGPACVIDFGTATTFNAVTKGGEYLGGAITAGVNLAAEALYTRAAKLPRIDLQRPPRPLAHAGRLAPHLGTQPRIPIVSMQKDKNRLIAVILATALLVVACRVLSAPAAGAMTLPLTPVAGYTFDLPADQGWMDTGFLVKKNQAVQIAYLSGAVNDARVAMPDASGYGYVCGRQDCCEPLPSAPRGALIGRVGQEVFYIGNGKTLSMPAAGSLQVRVNDCDAGLYDNRGSLQIIILP